MPMMVFASISDTLGEPQPFCWLILYQGTTKYCHSSANVRSMPKSLKHSPQIPPAGSVFLSGTFRRTLPVEPGPFFAQNPMPPYLEASYGPLGSTRFMPMPAYTISLVAIEPVMRCPNFDPCAPP